MQGHPGFPKRLEQPFEAFQRGAVDRVHAAHHENEMPHVRVFAHRVAQPGLEESRIGEREVLVRTNEQQMRPGLDLVPAHVAEMLAAADAPQHGNVGTGIACGEAHQRRDDAGRNTFLDAERQHADDGDCEDGAVDPVVAPERTDGRDVHEPGDRDDDDRSERQLRHAREHGCRGERDEADQQRREDRRELRAGARLEVDHRAREPARHRHAAAQRRADVGRAQGDQFLIRIDALAPPRGECFGDGKALDVAHQGDQCGRQDKLRQQRQRQGGQPGQGQAGRQRADLGYRVRQPGYRGDREGGDDDHRERAAARAQPRVDLGQPERSQQALERAVHEQQQDHGARAQQGGGRMRAELRRRMRGRAVPAEPEQARQLVDENERCRGERETGQHRVAQHVLDHAEAQEPHREEQAAAEEREQEGGGHRIRPRGEIVERLGHHQRGDGHRAHGERPARAEERVRDGRQHARVQPHFRRQTGEQRERHALRHQHDRGDDAGHQIALGIAAGVLPKPAGDGEPAGGARSDGRGHGPDGTFRSAERERSLAVIPCDSSLSTRPRPPP